MLRNTVGPELTRVSGGGRDGRGENSIRTLEEEEGKVSAEEQGPLAARLALAQAELRKASSSAPGTRQVDRAPSMRGINKAEDIYPSSGSSETLHVRPGSLHDPLSSTEASR